MTDYRIGLGYDIHRLSEGRKLILGGVQIENNKGLAGHSDADVIVHAVMDSILGAAALGDIGGHFPDTDPSYKNADSLMLLAQVNELVRAKNYSVGNVDVMVVAEEPKLAPHIPLMISNISRILGLSADAVSIKATTNEGISLIGKGEAIAAFSVALLHK